MLLALACNPFAGNDEEADTVNSGEVVQVDFDRSTSNTPKDNGQVGPPAAEQPPEETSSESPQEDVSEPPSEPPPAETPENPNAGEDGAESPPQETAVGAPLDANTEEVRDLAWAFLSQCVSISVNDLEARLINGQWFVQAAGESPDRFGIWIVDPATGSVEAHNIRARQWAPQLNSECTQDAFAQFYAPTPAPPITSGIADAAQATTSLWATLVKCYPAIQPENLQATQNPARAEWIVTGRPEVTTNYGVWAVRSNGEVVPHNRQAQGIYEQLGNGLC